MAQRTKRKIFYRRTIAVGNSSGVLLPRSLLGADVRVSVIRPPQNIKKDVMLILAPILENILGVYLISDEKDKNGKIESNIENKFEILAISTNINRHMEKGRYMIDISPLRHLKESLKQKPVVRENLSKAKTIINKGLLLELKKQFNF